MSESGPNIEDVRRIARSVSNWGRWGPDDELGTLNHLTPDRVAEAAGLVQRGDLISMAVPYDDQGPQTGGWGRFNPIHLMMRDGGDAVTGATVRDFYGGFDGYVRGTDDILIMPLQSGTQWDALAHMVFEDKIYNGYEATQVSSRGAMKNDIAKAKEKLIGRGVLLDVARWKGKDWLEGGEAISGDDLQNCADAQGVEIRSGDIVLVRTGRMARVKAEGTWGDYAAGYSSQAPGLGLASAEWIHQNNVAAVATDTWGAEVLPTEPKDVSMPMHIILIVHMGLTLGEIFDLEAIADDCDQDNTYEFLFSAPPLPITRAVGSPINPMAVK